MVGYEPSRIGDAFRPPSPAPFVAVTEAADGPERERERDRGRQNIGSSGTTGGCAESSFAAEHQARFCSSKTGKPTR